MNYLENIIFRKYGQEKNYERIKHNILNVRETMIKTHSCFCKKSLKKQIEYCSTIATIAVHTQLQHMNENRPLSVPENKRYEYSIDRDWKNIKYLELRPIKRTNT